MQDVEPRWLDITSSLVPLGRMMVRSPPEYTLYSTGHKRTVFAVDPQAAPAKPFQTASCLLYRYGQAKAYRVGLRFYTSSRSLK
jgi:hypothetical protein